MHCVKVRSTMKIAQKVGESIHDIILLIGVFRIHRIIQSKFKIDCDKIRMNTVISSATTKIMIQRGIAKKPVEDTERSTETLYINPKQRQEKQTIKNRENKQENSSKKC